MAANFSNTIMYKRDRNEFNLKYFINTKMKRKIIGLSVAVLLLLNSQAAPTLRNRLA
jgi:hypothetical protein